MLYYLHYLDAHYSWLNIFRYQTFRAMAAFLLSFVIVLLVQPLFIRRLQMVGVAGQPIRDDGPKDHQVKQGTPTMGGMVIVGAVLVATLLFADLGNLYVWVALLVMLAFAALGFVDDWRKIQKQNSKGLSERQKLLGQIGIAVVAGAVLSLSGFSSVLEVPFV